MIQTSISPSAVRHPQFCHNQFSQLRNPPPPPPPHHHQEPLYQDQDQFDKELYLQDATTQKDEVPCGQPKIHDEDICTTLMAPSPSVCKIFTSPDGAQCPVLRQLPDKVQTQIKLSRSKRDKKEKCKLQINTISLVRPLSDIENFDYTHISAYVNRSIEERKNEIKDSKDPEKVKRPMNAFMLYRKAFQNVAKDLCEKNNHQIISKVCGESWPLEDESVRRQFHEWAQIERKNHQQTFPDYKFSPSKPDPSKIIKRRPLAIPSSDDSTSEDRNWRNYSPKRARKYDSNDLVSLPSDLSNSSFQSNESDTSFLSYENDYHYLRHEISCQRISRDQAMNPITYHDNSRSSYQVTNPDECHSVSFDLEPSNQQYFQRVDNFQEIHPCQDSNAAFHKMAMPNSSRQCHQFRAFQPCEILELSDRNLQTLGPELGVDPNLVTRNPMIDGRTYMDYSLSRTVNCERDNHPIKSIHWLSHYDVLESIITPQTDSEINSENIDNRSFDSYENREQPDNTHHWIP